MQRQRLSRVKDPAAPSGRIHRARTRNATLESAVFE